MATMLDHATLRTHDLEGTRAFLTAVLDLEPGFRPGFSFPGFWLYSDGAPIVHLIPAHNGSSNRGGETIDHVGFRLTDYTSQCSKLDKLGVAYSTMDLPELGERRLFVHTPGGVLLELVFRDDSPVSTPLSGPLL